METTHFSWVSFPGPQSRLTGRLACRRSRDKWMVGCDSADCGLRSLGYSLLPCSRSYPKGSGMGPRIVVYGLCAACAPAKISRMCLTSLDDIDKGRFRTGVDGPAGFPNLYCARPAHGKSHAETSDLAPRDRSRSHCSSDLSLKVRASDAENLDSVSAVTTRHTC